MDINSTPVTARIATAADDDLLRSIVAELVFDPTAYTAPPKSFALVVEDQSGPIGCFLALSIEACAYAVQAILLPATGDDRAAEIVSCALETLFVTTDAEQIWTKLPTRSLRPLSIARSLGFRDQFDRSSIQHLRIDVDDWIQRLTMVEQGERIHEILRAKGAVVDHAADLVHDSYVGAAWSMTAAGGLAKGIRVYGRWARAAGYMPYRVMAGEPLRIDIGNCVLKIENDDFTVEEKPHA